MREMIARGQAETRAAATAAAAAAETVPTVLQQRQEPGSRVLNTR